MAMADSQPNHFPTQPPFALGLGSQQLNQNQLNMMNQQDQSALSAHLANMDPDQRRMWIATQQSQQMARQNDALAQPQQMNPVSCYILLLFLFHPPSAW